MADNPISEAHDLLVFIHGYNTTFADALRRTAQIFYDLDFGGARYSLVGRQRVK
jgi:esterase/lipase superfamily enzyme